MDLVKRLSPGFVWYRRSDYHCDLTSPSLIHVDFVIPLPLYLSVFGILYFSQIRVVSQTHLLELLERLIQIDSALVRNFGDQNSLSDLLRHDAVCRHGRQN